MKNIISLITCLLITSGSFAQESAFEEIVVTGIRSTANAYPGITYTKKGDFLLLTLLLSNDTRDADLRKKEIYSTLLNAISLSAKNSRIELSVIKNGFVIPLTKQNYKIDLNKGSRPDTSEIEVRVKTNIKADDVNPTKLITLPVSYTHLTLPTKA